MSVVADRILVLGEDRGYAGLRTDYDKRAIAVRWKGRPPADILDYFESRPLGVAITVDEGAQYSRLELEEARARILNSTLGAELKIVWTDLNDDRSGLELGVVQTEPLTAAQASGLRDVAGIAAVEVKVKVGAKPTGLYSRDNDSPPWWGGIRTIHRNSAYCTASFAVLSGGNGRLLSAGHCDTSGDGLVEDGGGTNIAPGGSSVTRRGAIDSLLIDPSASPATQQYMYRGAYNSSSFATVKNWAANFPGDPVCTSGASTGEHCGSVYDDDDTVSIAGYTVGVIQVSRSTAPMGGQGDSGGAMFRTVSGGVQARGSLVGPDLKAGSETTSCGTVDPDVAPITCSRWINYVPISTILNTWGVTLEVG